MELYRYENLPEFLKVYDLVCRSVRDADDFRLITYEALASAATGGARQVEFFFSPHAHQAFGVAYPTMIAGILAGMRDAESDKGVRSQLIPAHSRELGVARGEAFLDMVLATRPEEVIGIGLDYNEAPFPPAPFKPASGPGTKAGLHVTAHAGRAVPPPSSATRRHSRRRADRSRLSHRRRSGARRALPRAGHVLHLLPEHDDGDHARGAT